MPNSQTSRNTKSVRNVASKIGREMLPYPTKGTCPKDPPVYTQNQPKNVVVQILYTPAAAEQSNAASIIYLTTDELRTAVTTDVGLSDPCFVIKGFNIWGDLQHSRVYVQDLASGIVIDDVNGNVSQRPRVSLRYSKNIQPLISTSVASVNLIKIGVDSSSGLQIKSQVVVQAHILVWSY